MLRRSCGPSNHRWFGSLNLTQMPAGPSRPPRDSGAGRPPRRRRWLRISRPDVSGDFWGGVGTGNARGGKLPAVHIPGISPARAPKQRVARAAAPPRQRNGRVVAPERELVAWARPIRAVRRARAGRKPGRRKGPLLGRDRAGRRRSQAHGGRCKALFDSPRRQCIRALTSGAVQLDAAVRRSIQARKPPVRRIGRGQPHALWICLDTACCPGVSRRPSPRELLCVRPSVRGGSCTCPSPVPWPTEP